MGLAHDQTTLADLRLPEVQHAWTCGLRDTIHPELCGSHFAWHLGSGLRMLALTAIVQCPVPLTIASPLILY